MGTFRGINAHRRMSTRRRRRGGGRKTKLARFDLFEETCASVANTVSHAHINKHVNNTCAVAQVPGTELITQ